jgi:sugar lactone lactonase YvrE
MHHARTQWPAVWVAAALSLASHVAIGQGVPLEALDTTHIKDLVSNLDAIAGGKCRQPEGITLDPEGNIYTASNSDGGATPFPSVEYVCIFSKHGEFKEAIQVAAPAKVVGAYPNCPAVLSTCPPQFIGLVGEMWDNGRLYVLDQADNVAGNGRILRIDLDSPGHPISQIPYCGQASLAPAFPNTIVQDRHGNRYVTDSLQGVVYRFSPDDSCANVWYGPDARLLSTNPAQNVGLNDAAFDREEKYLYVDQTGNRQLYRIPVHEDGSAATAEFLVDGPTIDAAENLPAPTAIYGPDGVQFDDMGNLYLCANQAEEIQVFSITGSKVKLIHRYGGVGVNAMDFPASIEFRGHRVFITNMQADYKLPHSKLSVLQAPLAGLPLPLGDDE